MSLTRAVLLGAAVTAVPATAFAQTSPQLTSESRAVTAFSFAQIDQSGISLTGPKTLVVTRINPLRYEGAHLAGTTVTDDQSGAAAVAKGLASAFNFGNGAANAPNTSSTNPPQANDLNVDMVVVMRRAADACSESSLGVEQPPQAFAACFGTVLERVVLAETQAAQDGRLIAKTILDVDSTLHNAGLPSPGSANGTDRADYRTARRIASAATAQLTVQGELGSAWPRVGAADLSAKILAKNVALSQASGKNKDAIAALKQVSDALAPLLDDGKRRQAYDTVIKAQNDWLTRISAVAGDGTLRMFETPPLTVGCNNQLFDQHTTVAWKATDLVDTTKTAPVSLNVATVNCYSRIAVAQGAILAPRGTTDYSLATPAGSSSAGMQTIYASAAGGHDAGATPAMMHFRITPDSERVALHFTWAPFSVQKQFAGASLSFSRFLFLSAGVMRTEVTTLANGFAPGQSVPAGTTLSTAKSYPARFAYGLSVNVPAAMASGSSKTAKGAKAGENPPNPAAAPGAQPNAPPAATPPRQR
ncbi:MAG: hypothetical protein JWM87_3823 [Candidatus Eremiobacteraeota bacterium]|nr:hypothetical protein [Candidatus Eremiobacteraeota bacterium]